MSDHVSTPQMEEFSARTLENRRMIEIGEHLAWCEVCCQLLHEVTQRRRNYAPVVIDLSSEAWLRWEHFEYEQLVQYVDDSLDETEREMADVHLKMCGQCREDLRSFRLHRERMEMELSIRYAPIEKVSWRKRILGWWFK
ncbi:MAG: zf-HC2 domain-containing protein [Acidobacteriota bacterium]|nr:zf-HC2 domain-containing protein [Acidobacteriota bacterium]